MRDLILINILAVSLLSFSCSKKEEKQIPVLDLQEYIIDTLYLEKDTLTKDLRSDFNYFKTDSGEVLATFLNHQIQVFSYPEGKLLGKQLYQKEGPDGIGSFVTGNLIDETGIYFLSQQKELILGNFKGEIIERWRLPKVSETRQYANYSSAGFNKIQKSGNELHFVDIPHIFKEGFEAYDRWGVTFNITSGSFSNFNFHYPKNILEYTDDDKLGLFSHLYLSSSKRHLIGFAISDSVTIVENGTQTRVHLGTKETLEFKKGTAVTSGEYIVFQPNHESSIYEGLDFDSHAEKILRWVRVKGPTSENPNQEKYRLLVFDKNMVPEAELVFKSKEIATYGFNTPKGYALSLFTETTDDLTAFAIIDFSKISTLKN